MSEGTIRFQEVVPGSADDPFSASNDGVSPVVVASPAATPEGTPAVVGEDGLQVPPAPIGATPVSQPAANPAAPAVATPAAPQATPTGAPKSEVDVAAVVREELGKALRAQQSNYDKKIDALNKELVAARETALKNERESKLNNEDISDEDKDVLRRSWALDDRQKELDEYDQELDVYFRTLYVAKLVETHQQFGVTAEELNAIEEPEEMDKYVADKELDFYRSGRTLSSLPLETVIPGQTPAAPAGATAPTDIGGGAPAAPVRQLSTEQGSEAMRNNLELLPWESLPRPN